MMDDRTRRLGQHTAQTAPAWAVAGPRAGARQLGRPPRLGAQGRPGDSRWLCGRR